MAARQQKSGQMQQSMASEQQRCPPRCCPAGPLPPRPPGSLAEVVVHLLVEVLAQEVAPEAEERVHLLALPRAALGALLQGGEAVVRWGETLVRWGEHLRLLAWAAQVAISCWRRRSSVTCILPRGPALQRVQQSKLLVPLALPRPALPLRCAATSAPGCSGRRTSRTSSA